MASLDALYKGKGDSERGTAATADVSPLLSSYSRPRRPAAAVNRFPQPPKGTSWNSLLLTLVCTHHAPAPSLFSSSHPRPLFYKAFLAAGRRRHVPSPLRPSPPLWPSPPSHCRRRHPLPPAVSHSYPRVCLGKLVCTPLSLLASPHPSLLWAFLATAAAATARLSPPSPPSHRRRYHPLLPTTQLHLGKLVLLSPVLFLFLPLLAHPSSGPSLPSILAVRDGKRCGRGKFRTSFVQTCKFVRNL